MPASLSLSTLTRQSGANVVSLVAKPSSAPSRCSSSPVAPSLVSSPVPATPTAYCPSVLHGGIFIVLRICDAPVAHLSYISSVLE